MGRSGGRPGRGEASRDRGRAHRARQEEREGQFVGAVTRSDIGDDVYTFNFNGVDSASPYQRPVKVARQAHKFHRELVRTYDRRSYNIRVHRITKRQLNRAANAVADVLAALS